MEQGLVLTEAAGTLVLAGGCRSDESQKRSLDRPEVSSEVGGKAMRWTPGRWRKCQRQRESGLWTDHRGGGT